MSSTPDTSPADVQPVDPYAAAIACGEAVLRALKAKQSVDTEGIVGSVREIVQHIKGTDEYLLRAIHEKRSEEYLAVHSTNVMIIALKIGEAMKYDDNRLFLLGVTAFLHDLGMITVPERKGTFTDEDKALLRRHPEATRELIKGMGPAFAEIADIAVQEQEYEDGSGYPAGLSGKQIHEFAKIIRLADTYEAMTHSRSHREGFVAHKAVKEVIDLRTSRFARDVVKALITVVSIYPLGSLVKLNTGAIGRVMLKSTTHPTRPTIRLLKDAQGRKIVEERLINLEQEPMLYIADAQVPDSEVEEEGE
jgi:HD-GYP domain-containing protein (c-di-GMP phosphodiesterase class II)